MVYNWLPLLALGVYTVTDCMLLGRMYNWLPVLGLGHSLVRLGVLYILL